VHSDATNGATRGTTCKGRATKVLALCLKPLAADWQRTYGYRPLLVETYVDRERFRGTCYRAANWIYVGRTAGRGRQDRECHPQRSVKDIYVYPLSADWQRRLCREPLRKPQRSDGELTQGSWAHQEFSATLSDRRLHRRVVSVAEDFYAKPQANIAQACGSRAKTRQLP